MQADILLEAYLDGPEVDVDLVISQGQAVYGAITDNWPTIEPYFNETGVPLFRLSPSKSLLANDLNVGIKGSRPVCMRSL